MERTHPFSFLIRLAVALVLALAGPALATETVAGNYLLSQVEDAGGELRLQADGRYEWFVSAGSVNRKSAGRWVRAGEGITLTPDDPENPSGITLAVLAEPWNDDAERRYLRTAFENDWADLLQRCPLYRVKVPAFESLAADPARNWQGAARTALREADAAHRAANAAIAQWNRTKQGSPEWDASLNSASEALIAYNRAFFHAEDMHEKAKLPAPVERAIAYPARCALPRALPSFDPVPKERHPQIGIIIGNPEVNTAFIGVQLRVFFSDGSNVETVSGPGGWTSLPVQPGKSVRAIRAMVDYDDPDQFTVPIALTGAGVVIIDINPEAFAVRKLEPTALLIAKDGSLHGTSGVYVRK